MNPEEARRVYDEAVEYLLEFEGVDRELLERQLDPSGREAESIPDLYEGMLLAVQNRQGMPNSIGAVSDLEGVLYGFDPERVLAEYDSWREFFRRVERSEDVSPPGRFVIDNANSHWVQFSKSVLSAAEFLVDFDSVAEFDDFVTDTSGDGGSGLLAVPQTLGEEVHGLGFATAANFLKDNGYPEFVKPDVHVRELFVGIGVSDPDADDEEVFEDVVAFAEALDVVPYEVDRLFWTVGSGRFTVTTDDDSEYTVPANSEEFLDRL